jgi:geranylgeranyl pyrophosphate synthase
MKETSEAVIPIIKKAYAFVNDSDTLLLDSISYFVRRRTRPEQLLLRPYLVRIGYELAGSECWDKILNACAAVEILNISTYQSNLAFDHKNGILSESKKDNQFISSMISLGIISKLILELQADFSEKLLLLILNRIQETNAAVYIGQFYDLNILTLDILDLSMSESDYLRVYIERCGKLGGELTSLCLEIGYLLGKGDKKKLDVVRTIGIKMGTAGQIVNDISDLIYHEGNSLGYENYKDCFSDLKIGKVTYPLFHLFQQMPDIQRIKIVETIRSKSFRPEDYKEITKALCKYKTVEATKKIILWYYNQLKKEIKKIEKCVTRDFLSLAFSSLLTNKYFASLKQFKQMEV